MSLALEADVHAPRRTPRKSHKAALEYLAVSGAASLTIIERDGVCTIKVGDDGSSAHWWTNAEKAVQVARMARRFAGRDPDLSKVTAALARSAGSVGASLTPHDVAIERAGAAASRLDSHMEAMRRSGALKEFNQQFKRRRMEATLNGRGFMSFKVAEARLRRALIPMLTGGGRPAVGAGVFAGILGAT